MAILVTGGAGYIGSVTVECLISLGETVIVVDNLKRGHRSAIDPGVRFYEGDIGDRVLLQKILSENHIEGCVHFAALAYVGESVEQPSLYFQNNVEHGHILLHTLAEAGVRQFVFSSSCATYGEPEETPIRESSRQWPKSPYGWSKLFFERMLASYDTAYGMRFVALRYFNAAGASAKLGEAHEPETHLIANVLLAASGKQAEVHVFGNNYPTTDGTAIRDYIHVADLAEAHAKALQYLRAGGASQFLNLGTGRGHSVLEVIERAREVTERAIQVSFDSARLGDPAQLVADSSRAAQVLGWSPAKSDLTNIISSAWRWHLLHPNGYRSA